VFTTTSPEDPGTLTGFRLTQTNDSAITDTIMVRAGNSGPLAVLGPVLSTSTRDFMDFIPTEYSISVYPNPFNPATTLEFGLPKAGDVSIKVYDITGRLAADVVGGHHDAGWHRYTFNATDLAAGMYFARITSGTFVDVKKMMLIK
jgi:hypothetical protein